MVTEPGSVHDRVPMLRRLLKVSVLATALESGQQIASPSNNSLAQCATLNKKRLLLRLVNESLNWRQVWLPRRKAIESCT